MAEPLVLSKNNRTIESLGAIIDATQSNGTNVQYNGKDHPARAILLESAGAVKITGGDGVTATFASGALAVGVWHPMIVVRVWDTGTDTITIKLGF